jgi:acetylornithine deacetylase
MTKQLTDEDLLARLVAFPTVSENGNRDCADFLSDYLDDRSIKLVRMESTDKTRVNLIARVGENDDAEPGEGLTLCGHLDVVPALEPGWQSDPFTLRIKDEAYVGRGACDMKGFVALAVNAVKRAAGERLKHPLALVLTYDEEVGSLGAWRLAREWNGSVSLPRGTIVGEPTSMRVVRLHKGHLKLRITLKGVGAHSGYPELGVNAIEPAGRAIVALSKLGEAWKPQRHETSRYFPETPHAALNIAMIAGGTAVNIVPDRCILDIGVRPLPGMNADELVDEVRRTVLSAVNFDACSVEVVHVNPALCTEEQSPNYRRLCELVNQGETVGVSYASDAGVLSRMGLDCVLWGPGDIAVAHKPNEYLSRAEFAEAAKKISEMIRNWCVSVGG